MTPFSLLDSLLIAPFRAFSQPEAAFLFGMVVLALGCAVLGLLGAALVAYAQRVRWAKEDAETRHRQELSFEALRRGDKKAYNAQNMMAQEAYTNTMALSAGRAAATLWPACAVLTWLYWRFEGVPMPYLWDEAGPATVFLPLYIGALWGLARLRRAKKAAPPTTAGDAASQATQTTQASQASQADTTRQA